MPRRTFAARWVCILESMYPNSGQYQAYILRIWQIERDDQPVTLASLEDGKTGQCQVFGTLQDLLKFLEAAVQASGLPPQAKA